MRSMQDWFDAYGESHQNALNKAIHWICVPTIFFCVVGLLAAIPPTELPLLGHMPWAKLVVILGLLFYVRLSIPMAVGMALWSFACLGLARYLELHAAWPLWLICTVLFVAAWIGQFYGHKVEGKKPSFLEDLQFLMIGPAWLMGFIYRRLGIPY